MNFKSFSQLVSEMVDYLAGTASALTDLNIGSATRSLIEAVALVLAEVHYLGEQLISRFFVSSASGQWLDARAAEYGIARIKPSPTLRELTVSHDDGPAVTIPVGQVFATLPGAAVQVAYQVTQAAVLPAGPNSVAVDAVSTTSGSATAIPDGTALRQQGTPLAYVDAAVTSTITTAGTDKETDDHLRARVLDHLQHPAGPGSAEDYERAVLEQFPGVVESVTVVPNWAGVGTVKVLILGPGNTVPSAPVIAEVQAFLDGWAPIGAVVTVAAPAVRAVDAQATVWIGAGLTWAEVNANATLAVQSYLGGLPIGADALMAAVGNAIWDTAGVGGGTGQDGGNYGALQLRVAPAAFAAADVAIGAEEKATSGTITLTQGT